MLAGGGQALASIWSKGAPVPAKCNLDMNWFLVKMEDQNGTTDVNV